MIHWNIKVYSCCGKKFGMSSKINSYYPAKEFFFLQRNNIKQFGLSSVLLLSANFMLHQFFSVASSRVVKILGKPTEMWARKMCDWESLLACISCYVGSAFSEACSCDGDAMEWMRIWKGAKERIPVLVNSYGWMSSIFPKTHASSFV